MYIGFILSLLLSFLPITLAVTYPIENTLVQNKCGGIEGRVTTEDGAVIPKVNITFCKLELNSE
jgi:hypothetical protein